VCDFRFAIETCREEEEVVAVGSRCSRMSHSLQRLWRSRPRHPGATARTTPARLRYAFASAPASRVPRPAPSASAASASTSNLLLLLLDLLDLLLDLQGQLMTDPVCDKDGHAYERTAILQRLANGRLLAHDG
jgi:hypothetical protein